MSILSAGKKIFIDATVDAIITSILKQHCKELHILEYKDFKAIHKRSVLKSNIKYPYAYDMFFSEGYEILLEIDKQPSKVSEYGMCENACATSDAYKLKDFIYEQSDDKNKQLFFKVINTGTIDKYISKWGRRRMVYLGNKYTKPIVDKLQFESSFKNSYGKKAGIPKLILKGVTLMDVCVDMNGSILHGKTTLIVTSDKIDNLKFLLAILNSNIVIFYLKRKYPSSSFNSCITFTKEMINDFPMPVVSFENRVTLIKIIDDILSIKQKDVNADVSLYQKNIDDIVIKLYDLKGI